ncbi:glycosyltransferase [uncultured Polaribacter sp.]|uniref:glycosyltransferase n=1 Tax=uncultured Polaribacter sp. TaxID=174711 RepID=UPI002629B7B0|nr:glycosyltransferase [uncultured Polaribacter sp.]
MKVLLISTYDIGGAGKACVRLHKGLIKKNVKSNILCKIKTGNVPFSINFHADLKEKTFFEIKLNKLVSILNKLVAKLFIFNFKKKSVYRSPNLELLSFPQSKEDITESKLFQRADIINLHWVSNFLDYNSFFKKNTKPVVWTLHDMNPFSGGEHFTENYLGIDNNGYPVKRTVSREEKDLYLRVIEYKLEALKNVLNLHIVVLCEWMYKEVKKSKVFKKYPVYLIPNGIDKTIFKPRDVSFSRVFFDLPLDKKIVLFVAENIKSYRKGFVYLQKAIEKLQNKDFILCSVGYSDGTIKTSNSYFELGQINDERLMSMIYSSADVFVIPSLMDNLPNTAIESLVCGTPVIGFPVGGITDIINHGENGLLAKEVSVDSLLEVLNVFIKSKNMFNRKEISEKSLKKYDHLLQAESYYNLYEKVLKEFNMNQKKIG